MNLSNANASFVGEDTWDYAGFSVSYAGDVNGDGFDDIIIGANGDEYGSSSGAGQSYLVYGRTLEWAMDTTLSEANASFFGEDGSDSTGVSVSYAGDVNGDGFDDLIIGAYGDEEGGSWSGQNYLVYGRAQGWSMRTNLSEVNASFIGEGINDYSGWSVSYAGDVNGDGFDDLLIGAYRDEIGGQTYTGQTYLVFGRAESWGMDTSLSDVNASLVGEDGGDRSGISVSFAGDVNGDGVDDILIGAYQDEDGGADAGQTYLVFGDNSGFAAKTITAVTLSNQSDYSISDLNVTVAGVNSPMYINITATGGSATSRDIVQVWVNSTDTPYPIKVKAIETGDNTNEYHGIFYVRTAASNKLNRRVHVLNESQVFITTKDDQDGTDNLLVYYGSGPEAGVNSVSDCQVLDTANAMYEQTADIEVSALVEGPCINITAENVTFNGQGFAIFNTSLGKVGIYSKARNSTILNVNVTMQKTIFIYGVYLYYSDYSTVRNSTLNSMYNGLNTMASSNVTVDQVTTNSNQNYGILMMVGGDNSILNSTASGNSQYGMGVSTVNTLLLDCNTSGNSYGMSVSGAGSKVINSTADSNSMYGFYAAVDSLTFDGVTANSNSQYGILFASTSYHTIVDSTFTENTRYDFAYTVANDADCINNFTNVTGSGGGLIGFYNYSVSLSDQTFSELVLCNADYSTLNNITIVGSATKTNNAITASRTEFANFTAINSSDNYFGLYLDVSSNNNVFNSSLNDNQFDGLRLSNSDNNNLSGNVMNSNGEYGLYLLTGANNNTIGSNTIQGGSTGMVLSGSSYNTLTDNNLSSLGSTGIYFAVMSLNNTAVNNTVGSIGTNGFLIATQSQWNTLIDNTMRSSGYGIQITASSNNTVIGGMSFNNSNGIYLNGMSRDIVFDGLAINASRSHAIYLMDGGTYHVNFTDVTVTNTASTYKDLHNQQPGINGTWFIDSPLGNYSLAGAGGLYNFKTTGYGAIRFLEPINGTGNFSSELVIGNNTVYVDQSKEGLNMSANITLYGIDSWDLTDPVILRNGQNACDSTTDPACYNFTSLTAAIVDFNVTESGNYSIMSSAAACSGTAPPASGDWVIQDTTLCANMEIIHSANITVEYGANLTFDNVTLIMNLNESENRITNNGTFIITGSNLTAVNLGATNRYWTNVNSNNNNATMITGVDLSGMSSVWVNFTTWFDIEDGWDYGYVEVDNGTGWVTLPGTYTTDTNPQGNNDEGNGITGLSGGWVDEAMDLTGYVDQVIDLQFRYKTDPGTLNTGWYIDNITIDAIGFSDYDCNESAWNVTDWEVYDEKKRYSIQNFFMLNISDSYVAEISAPADFPGAIYAKDANLTMSNVTFTELDDHGIYALNTSAVFDRLNMFDCGASCILLNLSDSAVITSINSSEMTNAIELHDSDYVTVSDSECSLAGDSFVYAKNSQNITISDNTLLDVVYGITFEGTSYSSILNNTFDRGVNALVIGADSHHNLIENNTVFNVSANGMRFFDPGCEFNQILRNTISQVGWDLSNRAGIFFFNSANNNTIAWNNCTNNNFAGFVILTASYNNISHNLFNENDMGIWVQGSFNYFGHNTLAFNRPTSTGAYYAQTSSASNNIFYGENVHSSLRGINFVSSATNNLFINLNVSNMSTDDVRVTSSAAVTLLNSTFDDAKLTVSTATLTVKWYVNANVTSSGSPVSGATVRFIDSDLSLDQKTTGAQGFTTLSNLTEYVKTVSNAFKTPHVAYAYDGASSKSMWVNVNQSMLVDLPLGTDSDVPNVMILAPANQTTVTDMAVNFTYNVTDPTSVIANCTLYINGTINQTKWYPNGTQGFDVTMPAGIYDWNISCVDLSPAANTAYGLGTALTVVDTNLTACGVLSAPNTVYTVAQDVNSSSTCFNITAVNVTLDCAGYAINYSQGQVIGYGVTSDQNGSIVKNCSIYEGYSSGNSDYAIRFTNSMDSQILNNNITTYSIWTWSVRSDNSHGLIFFGNTIDSGGSNNGGAYLSADDDANISQNVIDSAGTGMYLDREQGAMILNNNITAVSTHMSIGSLWSCTAMDFAVFEDNYAGGKIINFTNSSYGAVFDDVDYGQILLTDSGNYTVKNTNFTIGGITAACTENLTVYNNTFNVSGRGIVLGVGTHNVNISDNYLESTDEGIYQYYGPRDGIVSGNTIRTTSNGYGIFYSSNIEDMLVTDNVIETCASESSCIGIYLNEARKITIQRTNITSGGRGMQFANGNNSATVMDSSITAASFTDIYETNSAAGSYVKLINVTYDKADVTLADADLLVVVGRDPG